MRDKNSYVLISLLVSIGFCQASSWLKFVEIDKAVEAAKEAKVKAAEEALAKAKAKAEKDAVVEARRLFQELKAAKEAAAKAAAETQRLAEETQRLADEEAETQRLEEEAKEAADQAAAENEEEVPVATDQALAVGATSENETALQTVLAKVFEGYAGFSDNKQKDIDKFFESETVRSIDYETYLEDYPLDGWKTNFDGAFDDLKDAALYGGFNVAAGKEFDDIKTFVDDAKTAAVSNAKAAEKVKRERQDLVTAQKKNTRDLTDILDKFFEGYFELSSDDQSEIETFFTGNTNATMGDYALYLATKPLGRWNKKLYRAFDDLRDEMDYGNFVAAVGTEVKGVPSLFSAKKALAKKALAEKELAEKELAEKELAEEVINNSVIVQNDPQPTSEELAIAQAAQEKQAQQDAYDDAVGAAKNAFDSIIFGEGNGLYKDKLAAFKILEFLAADENKNLRYQDLPLDDGGNLLVPTLESLNNLTENSTEVTVDSAAALLTEVSAAGTEFVEKRSNAEGESYVVKLDSWLDRWLTAASNQAIGEGDFTEDRLLQIQTEQARLAGHLNRAMNSSTVIYSEWGVYWLYLGENEATWHEQPFEPEQPNGSSLQLDFPFDFSESNELADVAAVPEPDGTPPSGSGISAKGAV